MNKIIEKISWIPYNLFTSFILKKKQNKVELDLNKIKVDKKFKFYLSKNDVGLSLQLKAFKFREPLNFEYYVNFISKKDNVMDIGANLGIFTLLSENAKKIISVEPLEKAIPILEKNIKENNLKDKTKIINAAVGKENEKLFLEENPKLNLSKVSEKEIKGAREIKSISLKKLVREYNTNVLRMDVEGFEYEILYKNIPKKVNKISLEFHTALLGKEKSKRLLDYFKEEKFKIKYLIEDLPIRLYPFYTILKKTNLLRFFTYVKKDINYPEAGIHINKYLENREGRAQKYFFLER